MNQLHFQQPPCMFQQVFSFTETTLRHYYQIMLAEAAAGGCWRKTFLAGGAMAGNGLTCQHNSVHILHISVHEVFEYIGPSIFFIAHRKPPSMWAGNTPEETFAWSSALIWTININRMSYECHHHWYRGSEISSYIWPKHAACLCWHIDSIRWKFPNIVLKDRDKLWDITPGCAYNYAMIIFNGYYFWIGFKQSIVNDSMIKFNDFRWCTSHFLQLCNAMCGDGLFSWSRKHIAHISALWRILQRIGCKNSKGLEWKEMRQWEGK